MKKINFKNFGVYTGILKTKKDVIDVRKELADIIYTQAAGIVAHDLAFRIYKSDGEIEVNEEEAAIILRMASTATGAFYDSVKDIL